MGTITQLGLWARDGARKLTPLFFAPITKCSRCQSPAYPDDLWQVQVSIDGEYKAHAGLCGWCALALQRWLQDVESSSNTK